MWFSFFAAALWALNPVQTNAVTYIVQRMTSLAALFYLATLAFYVQGRLAANRTHRGLFYVFSAGMAGCAFLSKENSYMLPVAIPGIDSGRVICIKVLNGDPPRSLEASSKVLSSFSSDTNMGKTINGR